MGTCKYCGQDAGWFSKKHKECEEKHSNGVQNLGAIVKRYFGGQATANDIMRSISLNRRDNYLCDDDICSISDAEIRAYTASIHRPFSPSSMKLMDKYLTAVGVSYSTINRNGSVDEFTKKLMRGFMVEYFTDQLTLPVAHTRCEKVLNRFPMTKENIDDAYYYVLNKAASNFLKNGIITDAEQQKIDNFINYLSLPINNLPAKYQDSEISKIGQIAIIKNIQKGIIPKTQFHVPIILGKNESVLWSYNGITMYEEKITKEWVGRTGGFSVRIIKGVYYRTGQMKGRPVEHSSMVQLGVGALYVTNKNLIFNSPTKGLKIPFTKIVGVTPYSDGLEIQRDGANAKRLTAQGFDPWFIMNLLSQISNI
ncbi:MAG: hypothetical protein IIV21_00405 [Bacteroidales bacterium]|nr:hypothetical protein [Bacteroidales bacterium]